ncbi:TonB family C-terminal domain-containing protein [Candidatus Electrothrix communis]|uniref:TonB family C-terminal domain-containing protein n=1 Tax=Candidatus Electrothrix communis TaxID=1859133 RepID=A0A444J9S1_9BACT|nr:TonB family C-terminal domain-containing protein [Candidatus Electrothrix communis]
MNEAMQRMLPATVLTLALHGALLSWRMQLPETVRPAPLPQKISVSLKRLPPPPPPLKKIVQAVPALPKITATEHQPIRPLLPKPKPKPKPEPLKKIVQKAPALPKIRTVQHQAARPLMLKPGKKISAVPQPLPKLAPVIRQAIKPLAVQPIKKPEPQIVRTPVRSTVTSQPIRRAVVQPVVVRQAQPVISRQQPVVRRTITSRQIYQQPIRQNTQPIRQQPVRRTLPITRQVVSSTPVRTTTRTTPPVSTGVVQEAAPLYQSNPPPEYPRMARRRGLEGVVTIEAKIDINGRVEELRLFAGSGHTILDKAALKAVRGWRFSPGTVRGRTQTMWVKVPVRFELH